METARGLGELLKSGWRPSRTIVLALWDGEEWGLLGSTEWAEKHDAELKQKAAVYINTDGTGKGWLNAGGSHGLQQFMGEVAKDVMDPAHRQAGLRGGSPPRRARRAGRCAQGRRGRSVIAHRAARIGIGLHTVPPALDGVGAERRLRRRESRRRVSLGIRHHQVVPDLFRHRLQLRTHAVATDRHAGPPTRRCAGAAIPVHRHRRHSHALRRRAREARRDEEGFKGRHEAGPRRCRIAEGCRSGLREGVRDRSARRIRNRCSRRKSSSS